MAKKKQEEIKQETEKQPQEEKIVRQRFKGLSEYKIKNNIKEIEYKKQEWIDMSPAFKHVTKLPGIPMGHVVMNYGKSDVGKTTMLMEAGAYAQKQGVLPVLILTENKFSWERAETMGLHKDECIAFNGIQTIEGGVARIKEILKEQAEGKLKLILYFYGTVLE